jgi:ABC-2 type transport system ATP-binding protein
VSGGEIVGVVGPNGAGKTSLFKILARCNERYEGSISFEGKPLAEIENNRIGYLAQTPFQFEFFSPVEMLLFERAFKQPLLPEEEVFKILRSLDLDDSLHEPIKRLSTGMKKRVALAAAFLGSPSLIILDEPTNSLDIQTVIILKRLIREALQQGATILISSHVLDFFDNLLERVVFLDQGVIHCTSSNDPRTVEEQYIELFMSQ